MPKLAPVIQIGLTLFGALMVLAAFLGVLYLGIGTNPPPLHIVVAARDIAQGEVLGANDYRVVDQIIDPRLASLYVQESDLAAYNGALVIETLRRGDPINKVKLAVDSNSAVSHRYALALKKPDEVVMALPVNSEVIPVQIATGDYVNILLAGGAESSLNQLPVPTPIPELTTGLVLTDSTAAITDASITLPLADLMLERVQVLDVIRPTNNQTNDNTAVSVNSVAPTSIVVKVPRSHQTLLMFGASTGKLRFAIASPALDAKEVQPQMGMDWAKYVALYRWKESQVVARGETVTQTLYPNWTALQPSVLPQANPPAAQPEAVATITPAQ